MKQNRKSYCNEEWKKFTDDVKYRDQYKCLKCGRTKTEVILQVHHRIYKPELEPWEYPLSDCITLCKGCHAREHGLVEPDCGWTLVSIDDLGDLVGECERKGCGAEIRYEHLTYHPLWGYKSVGSTCVEHLTSEDRFLSQEVLKIFKKISEFVRNSFWEDGVTKKGTSFIFTTHSYHKIRIYGTNRNYSIQIVLKLKGEKWFDYQKPIKVKNKNLDRVKEIAYIVLKGLMSENEEQKDLLRNIYKRIK